MGESGSEPQVQQSSTIRPSQEGLIDTAAGVIEGNIGQGATPYTGQMIADPSAISSQAYLNYQNNNNWQNMQGMLNSDWADPTYTYNQQNVTDQWQTGYADPMMESFNAHVVPGLEEDFAGGLYSTRASDYVADRSREFYGSTIAPTLFTAQQNAQQLGVQSAELSRNRQQTALEMPYQQTLRDLQIGAQQSGYAQRVLDAAYDEFLRTADEQDPWLQLAAQFGGMTTMETVGMQGTAGTDWGQMAASLGGSYMMASAMPSDRKVKLNITPIDDALYKLSFLTGYTYEFDQELVDMPDRRTGGIMAQDLEIVLPEVVHEINGIKHIDQGAVIGLLVNAVQELKSELEEIKNGNSDPS